MVLFAKINPHWLRLKLNSGLKSLNIGFRAPSNHCGITVLLMCPSASVSPNQPESDQASNIFNACSK